MKCKAMFLSLFLLYPSAHAEVEWLDYKSDADVEAIDDAVALGTGPDLLLRVDSLEGARILYGNPLIIQYEDGSTLTLKRYTAREIEEDFGHKLGEKGPRASDVPGIMLQYNRKPDSMSQDNPELVQALQEAGERLLRPLANRSERFVTQRYGKQLWFVLGDQESIGFIVHSQQPDQYLMIRAQDMQKSDFLARVVRGAMQPQGNEWDTKRREIPQQHMIPLPK